ncbi:hypothetical protein SEVIR_7G137900v4 [Setaria viridis]|uniref:Uncharacterized protein n=1 Tax=Setaria viridis TaxID=4556 RepID=A0A4U6TTK5_SETVI|nr:uncharacterized protein LOC117863980 [Setaria viridis]TKW04865.1 hypothetical protein SEVIR_7G137900v2 [Setaria viridis]
MSRRRTSAKSLLALVLLIIVSLLTLHAPIAFARHVVVLNPNDGVNNRGDSKNLSEVLASASTDDSAANKGVFSGRKLGVANKEEGITKATTGATATASAGSRPRTVKMREAWKHGDAAAEMYDMLRRDYAWKASRRRPINNGATRFQVKKP